MFDEKTSDTSSREEYLNDPQRVRERAEAQKAFKEWNALNDNQKRRKIQASLDKERKRNEERLIQPSLYFKKNPEEKK